MSGPKIVRVKTKQENISSCLNRIDALTDSISKWKQYALRHNAFHEEDDKNFKNQLHSINELFKQEKFAAVEKNCSEVIALVHEEINTIKENVVAKATLERTKRRRLQYSAETLMRHAISIDPEDQNQLAYIVRLALFFDDIELDQMSFSLTTMLTKYMLTSTEQEQLTESQLELTKIFSGNDKVQNIVELQLEQANKIGDNKTYSQLDALLSEIEAIDNKAATQPFMERILIINQELSPDRQALLIHSLIIELKLYLKAREKHKEEIASLREVRNELQRFTSDKAQTLTTLLTKAINAEDPSISKQLYEQSSSQLKEEKERLAGISRRKAILDGLSELGYEVQEKMITAWVKDGRLLVKKPTDANYGIELGAINDAEHIQIQLVTFEETISDVKKSMDQQQEINWCSEFSNLHTLLETLGTTIQIEKAIPTGTKPLKYIKEKSTQNTKSRTSVVNKRQHE